MASAIPSNSVDDFRAQLSESSRVLALLGAGLSASSGLPTFRGAGGLWRSHDATALATPQAFSQDPALVWRFYSYRRHMALGVQPNPAHFALAELARRMRGFNCLSQNVDGLSQRAQHPRDQLQLLHGTLFEVKCNDRECGYIAEDFSDPICPALDLPDGIDSTTKDTRAKKKKLDVSDPAVHVSAIALKDLPHCPQCKKALLRPNVVWFGESLPDKVLDDVDAYLDEGDVDLIMVIGTGAKVYPAAGYIWEARKRGASVCVVNIDAADAPPGGWVEGDFFFQGDAAVIVPELLRDVVNELSIPEKGEA